MIKRSFGRMQKLVSSLIPFYVLVGWNKVQEQQKEDGWKGQGEVLMMYSSNQDARN